MTTNQIFVFSHFNIYVYSQQILSSFANPQRVRSLRTQRVQLWSTAVINISPLSQHSSVWGYFQVMWCCIQGPYQRAESCSFCSWTPAFSRLSSVQIFTWYCARTARGCFLTRLEGHHSCWHHFMLQLLEHKVSLQGRPAAVWGALQRLYLCFTWCLQRCIKNRINKVHFSATDLIQSHSADTSEIYKSLISCFRCFRLTCTEGRV